MIFVLCDLVRLLCPGRDGKVKFTTKTIPSPCVLLHRGPKYFNDYYDYLLLQSLCSFVVLLAELLICVSALSSETRHVSYSLYRKEKKTVLTQEPTKSNHSLWMAISRFDRALLLFKSKSWRSRARQGQGSLAERKQGLI